MGRNEAKKNLTFFSKQGTRSRLFAFFAFENIARRKNVQTIELVLFVACDENVMQTFGQFDNAR